MFNDIKADYLNSNKSKTVLFLMIIYRFGNKIYYLKRHSRFRKVMLCILNFIYKILIYFPYNIEFPFGCKIGKGLRLIHYHGIVINGSAIIGENCTIFHQVTIGINEHESDLKKAALIGNNVYIGCGAKIIGNITIGDNVKIGANAIVTKSIPSNCTVVGINKVIKSEKELSFIENERNKWDVKPPTSIPGQSFQ